MRCLLRRRMLPVIGPVLLAGSTAAAATWTTGGGTFNTFAINAAVNDGDDIHVDENTTFNINTALNTDNIVGITVAAGRHLAINFTNSGRLILGNGGDAWFIVNGTCTVAGNTSGTIDFSNQTGQTLTVEGVIGGTASSSGIIVGNNTLRTQSSAVSLNDVTIGGDNARLDIDVATSIDTLKISAAGFDLMIDIADGLTLTIDDPLIIPAGSRMNLIGTDNGAAETLAVTGGLSLNGAAAELAISGDASNSTAIDGAITIDADGGIIDLANDLTVAAIHMSAGSGDLTIHAGGHVLTTVAGIDVNDNTLTLDEAGTITSVSLDTSGGVINASESITFTSAAVTGNAAVHVAAGKTLTITNGLSVASGNSLTLAGTGTISSITHSGTLIVDADAAIGTVNTADHCTIHLNTDAVNLTVANGINVGAHRLTVQGSGGGGQERLTATVNLNHAASELALDGADADNIRTTRVNVMADGATIDANIDCALTLVVMSASSGNLTLETGGNTITASVDVNDNTLILDEAGTIATINLDTNGGVIDVNEDITFTDASVTANATIRVAAAKTLTVTNSLVITSGDRLTLNRTGSISSITNSGTLRLDASLTIDTYLMGGNSTIDLNTNGIALNVANDIDVGPNRLTIVGSGGGIAETLNATVNLDHADSELRINGHNNDNIAVNTLNITASGALIDANISFNTPSLVMTAGNGDLTIDAASGATVTTVVDVNDNTLTLSGAGTVSQVDLDTAGGVVRLAAASSTITTLNYHAEGMIDLDTNGGNLTVTNAIAVGPRKLVVQGSGGGAQERLTATVNLDDAASELEINGADADNIMLTRINVMADGATIDANINCAPTLIDMNTGTGDLTLEVAPGKTLIAHVDVKNNTLTLNETGSVYIVQLNTNGGRLELGSSATITTLNVSADATITTGGNTLTCTNGVAVSGGTLTFDSPGTISAVNLSGGATLDIDENITIDTLTLSGDGTIAIDADGRTLTLSSDVQIGANTLTLRGSGGADAGETIDTDSAGRAFILNHANSVLIVGAGNPADNLGGFSVEVTADGATMHVNETCRPTAIDLQNNLNLMVASGKTLDTTIDINNRRLTKGGDGDISAVLLDTNGGTLDINGDTSITTLTQSADVTIDVAGGATLTATADLGAAGHTLSLTGTGTISTVEVGTGETLDVNDNIAITNMTATDGATLNIANDLVWDATSPVGASGTVTFRGVATVDDVDLVTPDSTITVDAGSHITINRFDPGFSGASQTLVLCGAGNLTIHDIDAGGPADGDTVRKTGTGILHLTSGFDFINGGGHAVAFDIDDGSVVIGSAELHHDIVLDDDGDRLTLSAGATLTTFGSFTVADAGPNVNIDAAIGSTINLSSNAGNETFTPAADNDFQLLGTVEINGTAASYAFTTGFVHQLGDVNLADGNSFLCMDDNARIRFVPGSRLEVLGSATLHLGSGTNGREVWLDAISNTGTFVIDRNASPNMRIDHLIVSRAIYASETGCSAAADKINIKHLHLGAHSDNWKGGCQTTPRTDETPITPDLMHGIADDGGSAAVQDAALAVALGGLTPGTEVSLATDGDSGESTITISYLDMRVRGITLAGRHGGSTVNVHLSADGNDTITIRRSDGHVVKVELSGAPTGTEIRIDLGNDGMIHLGVHDASRVIADLGLALPDPGRDVSIFAAFGADPPVRHVSQSLPDLVGFVNNIARARRVDVQTSGLSADDPVTVTLAYTDELPAGIAEHEFRLFRFDGHTSGYVAAGTNDVGNTLPTGVPGDFGVVTAERFVWAVLPSSQLGGFALGLNRTDDSDNADRDDEDVLADPPAVPPLPLCGQAGMLSWSLILSGLLCARYRRRVLN